MKKLLFILFISVFSIGCDDKEPTEAELSLLGTWSVTSHKIEYFDGAAVKQHEEVRTNDPDAFREILFTQTNAKITNNDKSVENSGYAITKDGERYYLSFTNQSISDVDKIEVSLSDQSTLKWYAEGNNVGYSKNNQSATAAKAKLTIMFAKK